MTELRSRDLGKALGSEVDGFDPSLLEDESVCTQMRQLFDSRGVLVFRDIEIDHLSQVRLAEMLSADSVGSSEPPEDRWYISNRREAAAAPHGRLQFHSDTMWSDRPCEVLSLYGMEVDPPVPPTLFASTAHAWATLPPALRAEVEGATALHTAGEVRRGNLEDVLLADVARPPTTVKPVGFTHPRTGETLLYVCEQMTREIVGMPSDVSEGLLERLFDHMYDPSLRFDHEWRTGDLVVWDNLAVQHARPNVEAGGRTRTLRKVATPMPTLAKDQIPTYSTEAAR